MATEREIRDWSAQIVRMIHENKPPTPEFAEVVGHLVTQLYVDVNRAADALESLARTEADRFQRELGR